MLCGAGGLEMPGRGGPTHATGYVGVGAANLMRESKLEGALSQTMQCRNELAQQQCSRFRAGRTQINVNVGKWRIATWKV